MTDALEDAEAVLDTLDVSNVSNKAERSENESSRIVVFKLSMVKNNFRQLINPPAPHCNN